MEWLPVSTPSPTVQCFRVGVKQAHWRGRMPDVGDTYRALDIPGSQAKPNVAVASYGTYTFTHFREGQVGDGPGFWLHYAPPISATAADTAFETFDDIRSPAVPWPMVLSKLEFKESQWLRREFTYNDDKKVQVPVVHVNAEGKSSYSGPTKVKVERFLGATAYTLSPPDVPVPDMIMWDIPGTDPGGFPSCLHDEIRVPGAAQRYLFVDGVTVSTIGESSVLGKNLIEKTNMVRWQPYYVESQQQLEDSKLWLKERVTYYPPRVPDRKLQ